MCSPVLDEADGSRLFTEALTAKVKPVFANQTSLVSAETALAATLAELSRTRKPDGVVGHFLISLPTMGLKMKTARARVKIKVQATNSADNAG